MKCVNNIIDPDQCVDYYNERPVDIDSCAPNGIPWFAWHDIERMFLDRRFDSINAFYNSSEYKKYSKLLEIVKEGSIDGDYIIGEKYAILTLCSDLKFLRISYTKNVYELFSIAEVKYLKFHNLKLLKLKHNETIHTFPTQSDNDQISLNCFVYKDISGINKLLTFLSLQPYDVTIYSY